MEAPREYERRVVSVLFADLVGFTTLSERLDPEDVATVQDAYFSSVREIIGRYGGVLEKFIGDAAMAIFGLPRSRDDDAERAVRAGLALVASIEQLGGRLGLIDNDLRVRVGVNSGEVVSAESGPDQGRVTGDTVNTAARLQTAAEPGQVLVGETTRLMVADSIDLGPITPLALKGKAAPVEAAPARAALPRRSRDLAMGRLRAPLIGRVDELGLLQRAIDRARGGASERWLVLAPPGVGKTRLVQAVEAAGSATGMVVWRARSSAEPRDPFEVVTQLVAAASGATAEEALRADLLAGGAPAARAGVLARELASLAGWSPAITTGERDERFDAWIEALDTLAGGPVAWLVEDLHWAGPDLLAFLARVGEQAAAHGRLVLATARPSLLERDHGWRADDHRLDLAALGPHDAAQLVHALVGDALPDELVAEIAEGSGGNPLFVEELLRTWVSIGVLDETQGGWRLVRPAGSVTLPLTVQAIYASQLDDLPPDSRRLARRASVAGRSFLEEELGPLDAAGGAALEQLTARAFVTGPEHATLGSSYRYRHVLLRDAGYASLARSERARLHVLLARWLAAAAAAPAAALAAAAASADPASAEPADAAAPLTGMAEEIAMHYVAALEALPALSPGIDADTPRDVLAGTAGEWLERAATDAQARAAHAAARDLLRRALDLDAAADPEALARRTRLLGDATTTSGDMDLGVAAYRDAAARYAEILAGATAGTPRRARARDGYATTIAALGTALVEQLQFEAAEALADDALGLIGTADDLPAARLRYLRAWARIAFRSAYDAADELRAVERIAARDGDPSLRLEAAFRLLGINDQLASAAPAEFVAAYLRVADLAEQAGQPRQAIRALRSAALLGIEIDASAADSPLARTLELAEAHGLLEEGAWARYAAAEAGLATGRWDEAWAAGQRALEIAEANAYLRPVVRTWFALSPIALARGDAAALARALAWFDPRRSQFPDSPFGRFMHGALDARFAAAGLMAAPTLDDRLLEAWDEEPGLASWYAAAETIVDAWVAGGHADLAGEAVRRSARWAEDPAATPLAVASHALLEAVAARTAEPAAARLAAARALDGFRSLANPWGIARALAVLEATGEASETQRAERAAIERHLGYMRNTPKRG